MQRVEAERQEKLLKEKEKACAPQNANPAETPARFGSFCKFRKLPKLAGSFRKFARAFACGPSLAARLSRAACALSCRQVGIGGDRLRAGASETCGSFRCGAPRAQHGGIGGGRLLCSAQQRSESKKKEQQARVRALTQRWTGATHRVLRPAPWCNGPRLDAAHRRAATSAPCSSCAAVRRSAVCGLRAMRAQHRVPRSATVPRHAHKGAKERTQRGPRSARVPMRARKGDQGAHGDSQSARRVQTGELLSIESATSAKASKRGLNLPPANPRPSDPQPFEHTLSPSRPSARARTNGRTHGR